MFLIKYASVSVSSMLSHYAKYSAIKLLQNFPKFLKKQLNHKHLFFFMNFLKNFRLQYSTAPLDGCLSTSQKFLRKFRKHFFISMFEISLLDVFSSRNVKDVLPHDILPQEVRFKKWKTERKETTENRILKEDYSKSSTCITRKNE